MACATAEYPPCMLQCLMCEHIKHRINESTKLARVWRSLVQAWEVCRSPARGGR
jgi:hypothetical protein